MVPDLKLSSPVYQFSPVIIYLTYIHNGFLMDTGKRTTMFIKCSWLVFDFANAFDRLKRNDLYKLDLFKDISLKVQ